MNSGLLFLIIPVLGAFLFFVSGGTIEEAFHAVSPFIWIPGLLIFLGVAKAILFPASASDPVAKALLRQQEDIGGEIEPERGDHHVVYVYKRLEVLDKWMVASPDAPDGVRKFWNGLYSLQLQADAVPTMKNTNGIYGYSDPNDRGMESYRNGHTIKVKVALRGPKVIHERGARGYHGSVVEVLDAEPGVVARDGNFLNKHIRESRKEKNR